MLIINLFLDVLLFLLFCFLISLFVCPILLLGLECYFYSTDNLIYPIMNMFDLNLLLSYCSNITLRIISLFCIVLSLFNTYFILNGITEYRNKKIAVYEFYNF